MLEHLEWEILESRRDKHQMTMLFKIINGIMDTRQRLPHTSIFKNKIPALLEIQTDPCLQ